MAKVMALLAAALLTLGLASCSSGSDSGSAPNETTTSLDASKADPPVDVSANDSEKFSCVEAKPINGSSQWLVVWNEEQRPPFGDWEERDYRSKSDCVAGGGVADEDFYCEEFKNEYGRTEWRRWTDGEKWTASLISECLIG